MFNGLRTSFAVLDCYISYYVCSIQVSCGHDYDGRIRFPEPLSITTLNFFGGVPTLISV
jgi:hypothetical protein